VALKKINITEFKEGVPSTAMREIAILTEVEDKNVVELKEVVLTD
jgi:cyclin-dependent kinase 2